MWAGIDLVLWGFTTKDLNTVTPAGLNLVPSLLGAVSSTRLTASNTLCCDTFREPIPAACGQIEARPEEIVIGSK